MEKCWHFLQHYSILHYGDGFKTCLETVNYKMQQIIIEFLGTGNAWSKPPRNYNTSAMVTCGENKLLLDCGSLVPLALKNKNIHLKDISDVFISHLHGDHVYGLEELAIYNRFVAGTKSTLWLPELLFTEFSGIQGEDIWHNCLRASLETHIKMPDNSTRQLQLEDYFNIVTLTPGKTYFVNDIPIEIFPVKHIIKKPSFGLLIDNQIAYTADTIFDMAMLDFLLERGIHTIFHDVNFEPPTENMVHATYEELKSLPEHIRKKIYLMHFDDGLTNEQIDDVHKNNLAFADTSVIYSYNKQA